MPLYPRPGSTNLWMRLTAQIYNTIDDFALVRDAVTKSWTRRKALHPCEGRGRSRSQDEALVGGRASAADCLQWRENVSLHEEAPKPPRFCDLTACLISEPCRGSSVCGSARSARRPVEPAVCRLARRHLQPAVSFSQEQQEHRGAVRPQLGKRRRASGTALRGDAMLLQQSLQMDVTMGSPGPTAPDRRSCLQHCRALSATPHHDAEMGRWPAASGNEYGSCAGSGSYRALPLSAACLNPQSCSSFTRVVVALQVSSRSRVTAARIPALVCLCVATGVWRPSAQCVVAWCRTPKWTRAECSATASGANTRGVTSRWCIRSWHPRFTARCSQIRFGGRLVPPLRHHTQRATFPSRYRL